ncbi:MAG: ATP synthase F0 subunit C [Deltaproteobacteria bacterium]|nr:ATP synthase F0 subunit C [Deltaproteobacteria bacterium]
MRHFGKFAFWALVVILAPFTASAEAAEAAVAAGNMGPGIGAGIAIGFAALGCGIGQGLTASATTAGIARNPGAAGPMFTPYILGMVLIESIAIYGLVIAFMLQGKA